MTMASQDTNLEKEPNLTVATSYTDCVRYYEYKYLPLFNSLLTQSLEGLFQVSNCFLTISQVLG